MPDKVKGDALFYREMAEANEAVYEVFPNLVKQLSSVSETVASRMSKLIKKLAQANFKTHLFSKDPCVFKTHL